MRKGGNLDMKAAAASIIAFGKVGNLVEDVCRTTHVFVKVRRRQVVNENLMILVKAIRHSEASSLSSCDGIS